MQLARIVAFLGVVAVGMVLIAFAQQPVNRYVTQRVENRVNEVLHTEAVCREGNVDEVRNCRALIERLSTAATRRQRRRVALHLLCSLTPDEQRALGMRPTRRVAPDGGVTLTPECRR